MPQPDSISSALQSVATHCLQLDLQARPKNAAQILADLASYWTSPAKVSTTALHTIIPDQAYIAPLVEQHPIPPLPPQGEPQPASGFFKKTFKILVWTGLAVAGFIAYQNYSEEQEKITKQERRLFAKARTLDDLKAYLEQCQICEAKQDAGMKIAQIEQEQQLKLTRQKQKKQEHLAYIKAQTIKDLQDYLASCELCLDKDQAESELKQKQAAEEKAKAEAAGSDLLNAVTKPLLDSAQQALDEVKNQAEAGPNPNTEAQAQAQAQAQAEAEAELKSRMEAEAKAEAKAQAQDQMKAELEQAIRKAEAEKKAQAEEKLKRDVENTIKESTGIDVKEIQNWIDGHKKQP